ncbi:MAG: hypothetical protein ACOCWG_04610, partial [bacterium]
MNIFSLLPVTDLIEESFKVENAWIKLLIIFTFLAAIFFIAYFITLSVLKQIIKRTNQFSLIEFRKHLKSPVFFTLMVVSVLISLLLMEKELGKIGGLQNFFGILLIGSVSWLLIKFTRASRNILLKRYDISQKNNLVAR